MHAAVDTLGHLLALRVTSIVAHNQVLAPILGTPALFGGQEVPCLSAG